MFDEAQHQRASDGKFSVSAGAKVAAHQKVKDSRAAAKVAAAQTVTSIGRRQYDGAGVADEAAAARQRHTDYMAQLASKAGGRAKAPTKSPAAAKAKQSPPAAAKPKSTPPPSPQPAPQPRATNAASVADRPAATSPIAAHPVSREAAAAHQAFVADQARRTIIGQGRTGPVMGSPSGATAQFAAHAQAAIRDHHNAVIAQYGLHNLDGGLGGGRRVEVDASMKVGGAQCYGSHGQNGDVALWGDVADHLTKHARLDAQSLASVGQRAMGGDKEAIRMIDAYRVSTHEALHGHGPEYAVQSAGTHTDEISTEVVARRIVGDLHGVPPHQLPGSYDRMIHPVVEAAAAAAGRSFPEAWAAVERASLDLKKQSNFSHVKGQVSEHFAGAILSHLGNNDPAVHAAFAEQYYQIGRSEFQAKVADKYKAVNRYL